MKKTNEPSKAELKVMKAIWKRWEDKKESDVYYVLGEVNIERKKDLTPQTVCTFLTRLQKKGYIKSQKRGRYNYYKPVITKNEWVIKAISEVCDIANIPSEQILKVVKKELEN